MDPANYEYYQMLASIGTAIGTIVMALAVVGTVIYAAIQVRKIKAQLERTGAYNRTIFSHQHNWALFEHHEQLPEALPSWEGLSSTGWAWRVLHLEHLNLLLIAYQDYNAGLINDSDWAEWILKARFWFQRLWAESTDPKINEGREVLRQLLRPEEGYSEKFCRWLVDAKIIPPDLVLR